MLSPVDIVNTCGAGDTFCAGLIHSILHPSPHEGWLEGGSAGGGGSCVRPSLWSMQFAMKYAEKSLKSSTAVPASVDLQEMLDEVKFNI